MQNQASVATVSGEAFASQKLGIVILSTGAPDHCITVSTFLRIFDATSKKVVDATPLIPVDPYIHKSEFPDHHGQVNAVALPPGDYYLSPWAANPYLIPIKIPEFAFKVQPGETVYVGELFMPRYCGLSTTLEVRDKYARDMKLAMEKNPLVGQRAAVKRLLTALPQ